MTRYARMLAAIVTAATTQSCNSLLLRSGEHGRDVESSTGELEVRTFKRVGISIAIPSDAMDVMSDHDRRWIEIYGRKCVSFVLAKVPMHMYNTDDMLCLAGHASVFSPLQYQEWKRSPSDVKEGGEQILRKGVYNWTAADEHFDTIQVYDIPNGRWGLPSTVYRLDRRSEDGRVFQAMITRLHYVNDSQFVKKQETLITNILFSVRFLVPKP